MPGAGSGASSAMAAAAAEHAAAISTTNGIWAAQQAEFDRCVGLLRAKAAEQAGRRVALAAKQSALADQHGGAAAAGSDKLKLNVGGTRVVVRRETLTQLRGSRLAGLFSGRWESALLRDKKGRIFLDVNPSCFEKIVDWHIAMKLAGPDDPPELPEVAPVTLAHCNARRPELSWSCACAASRAAPQLPCARPAWILSGLATDPARHGGAQEKQQTFEQLWELFGLGEESAVGPTLRIDSAIVQGFPEYLAALEGVDPPPTLLFADPVILHLCLRW